MFDGTCPTNSSREVFCGTSRRDKMLAPVTRFFFLKNGYFTQWPQWNLSPRVPPTGTFVLRFVKNDETFMIELLRPVYKQVAPWPKKGLSYYSPQLPLVSP